MRPHELTCACTVLQTIEKEAHCGRKSKKVDELQSKRFKRLYSDEEDAEAEEEEPDIHIEDDPDYQGVQCHAMCACMREAAY